MRKKEIKERLIECLLKRMEKRIRRGKEDRRLSLFFKRGGTSCGGRFCYEKLSNFVTVSKILRLSEPPPFSKGGQKEMQSYVGTRFFVPFFYSPLFAPVRGNVTIVTKGLYDSDILPFSLSPQPAKPAAPL